jgi:hypothetical protein
VPSGEKLGIYRFHFRAARSLQSGLSTNNPKYGHYSRISAQSERKSSAVQTVWRRKRDSNSRYGFVALRLDVSASCRLQNPAREFHPKPDIRTGQSVRFRFAICSSVNGERQAILWQKWSRREVPRQSDWVRRTACLPRSPKAKNFSAGCARKKANESRLSEIPAHLCDTTFALA